MTTPQLLWPEGPDRPELADGMAHLWCCTLAIPPDEERSMAMLLSPDERERAARYLVESGRSSFTAARATLRTILARYLCVEPGELAFIYSERGKPSLAPPFDTHGLSFNLSHAHGLAIFGITRAGSIGVDLELVRELPDMLRIAERFFAPAEQLALQQASDERRAATFFRIWTCKEAFLKADGEGISFPLDQIEVLPSPDGSVSVRRRGAAEAEPLWDIHLLAPASGYLAAVALPGEQWNIESWKL